MCEVFLDRGIDIVSNGTENHMFLLDFINHQLTGKEIEDLLETGKIKKFKVKDFKKFGSQRKLYNFNIDNISDY